MIGGGWKGEVIAGRMPNKYTGLGGYEGVKNLKGVMKPRLYGYVRQIVPVLVDPLITLYQVHDGKIEAIRVYYQDCLLTYLGDLPVDCETLVDWQPPFQFAYRTDMANGLFRLSFTPFAILTCDVIGPPMADGWKRGEYILDRSYKWRGDRESSG